MADTDKKNLKEDNLLEVRRTRRGRIVKQPAWYCLNNTLLQGSARQQGEDCKAGSRGEIMWQRGAQDHVGGGMNF